MVDLRSARVKEDPTVTEALERLRERVFDDPALQQRLRGLGSKQVFAARLVEVAAEEGLDLTLEEVDEALTQARREWVERWL